MGPVATQCGDEALFNGWVTSGKVECKNRCTLNDQCRFYGIWPLSHDNHYWCRLTATCDVGKSAGPHKVSTFKRMQETSHAPTLPPAHTLIVGAEYQLHSGPEAFECGDAPLYDGLASIGDLDCKRR